MESIFWNNNSVSMFMVWRVYMIIKKLKKLNRSILSKKGVQIQQKSVKCNFTRKNHLRKQMKIICHERRLAVDFMINVARHSQMMIYLAMKKIVK